MIHSGMAPSVYGLMSLLMICCQLCAICMMATKYLQNYIYFFTAQAWFVAILAIILAIHNASIGFAIVAALYIIIRGISLPYVFTRILKKSVTQIERDVPIQTATGLIASMLLIVFGTAVSIALAAEMHIDTLLKVIALDSMLGIFLIGFLMLLTRNTALSKVIALLMIENALIIAGEMLLGDANILLALITVFDVLMAVISFKVLSGYLIEQIDDTDNRKLTRLVG
jgi:hydrogenase-4 component E